MGNKVDVVRHPKMGAANDHQRIFLHIHTWIWKDKSTHRWTKQTQKEVGCVGSLVLIFRWILL
jgi:hypothetical protein